MRENVERLECDCGRVIVWHFGGWACIGCGKVPWACDCPQKVVAPVTYARGPMETEDGE